MNTTEPSLEEEKSIAGWNPPFSWYFSRALARETARRIHNQPNALERALGVTENALADQKRSGQWFYFLKWKNILTGEGLEGAARVLGGRDDDESQAMRTASPFSGWVITPSERDKLFSELMKKWELLHTEKSDHE